MPKDLGSVRSNSRAPCPELPTPAPAASPQPPSCTRPGRLLQSEEVCWRLAWADQQAAGARGR